MKIGIITMYHNSYNYGGVLQAYALCRYLNEEIGNAEQIDYDTNVSNDQTKKGLKRHIRSVLFAIHKKSLKKRYVCFDCFRKEIPHSSKTYNVKNYYSIPDEYDTVITGSDQVWNFKWFNKAYFLDFEGCKKISYAASLGMKTLADEQRKYLEPVLQKYEAVSVREKDSVDLLSPFVKDVVHVLDPVFLLTKDHWSSIASERKVKEPYVYCHFIGNDYECRRKTKEFAKRKGLKLIVLPHPSHFNSYDLIYSTRSLTSASPQDFISLIKNAEYVFTDSFHCSAFSVIFEKQFFVFHRCGEKEMSTRIESLLSMVNAPAHFVRDIGTLDANWESCMERIDYKSVDMTLECAKNASKDFLLHSIIKAQNS